MWAEKPLLVSILDVLVLLNSNVNYHRAGCILQFNSLNNLQVFGNN